MLTRLNVVSTISVGRRTGDTAPSVHGSPVIEATTDGKRTMASSAELASAKQKKASQPPIPVARPIAAKPLSTGGPGGMGLRRIHPAARIAASKRAGHTI